MTEADPIRTDAAPGAEPAPETATEVCAVVAGRLIVAYDRDVHGVRHEVLVTVDGRAPLLMRGTLEEGGGQLVGNGDFRAGVRGWQLADGSSATLAVVDEDDDPAAIGPGPMLLVRDRGASLHGARVDHVGTGPGGSMPVEGGATYRLAFRAVARDCAAAVVLEFDDAEGRLVGSTVLRIAAAGDRAASADGRVRQALTPPGAATSARLGIRVGPPLVDAAVSSVRIAEVSLSRAGRTEAIDLLPGHLRTVARAWSAPSALAISLPTSMFDGRAHELHVDDPISGRRIGGSPIAVPAGERHEGAIEDVNGPQLRGWVSSPSGDDVTIAVEIDGTEVARETADRDRDDGSRGFAVGIPAGYLDGAAHHLVVRALPSGVPIDEAVRLLPRVLTPWDALARYASDPLPAELSPLAGHRYRSLRLDAAAAATPPAGADVRLPHVGHAHEVLLRGFERPAQADPLVFPRHDDPVVSVVIPVHDKFAVTYHCLAALLFAHVRTPFEVIVVDDASTDETTSLGDLVSGITIVRNEENLGFVGACNHGAEVARGRYITFLNNDTEPTATWLDEVMAVFENFDDVGLVGSKLIYPDGRLQEAGGIVWADGNPWNYGRDENAHRPEFNYTRQADYLSGAAITIDRETWSAVGGFSSEYAPAYFEDTDLAFKVRAHGQRTVYAPFSVVVHHEGLSSGTSVASGMKRFQEVNRPRFKQKWRDAFVDQPIPGSDVHQAKDRGVIGRVLLVDSTMPQPDRNAGSYAAIQEMRLIQSLGYKVSFLPENLAWLGADTEYLQRMGVEVLHAPFVTGLEDLLRDRGDEFDLVYVTRFEVAARAYETIRRLAPQAKIALTLADLHFLRQIRDAISGQGTMEVAIETREKELAAIRDADVTLSYSDIEHAVILSHNLATGNVSLAPWVVEPEPAVVPLDERRDIAFLGSYAHPPNAQAVRFFVTDVMPLLRERLPGVRFRVYGSGWPDRFTARLAADDVVFEGFVDRIGDALGRCRVAVAPLVSGAGLKGKVIDALSCGTPQVLTPIAAEGTGLRDGIEVLIAERPADWTDALVRLFEDDDAWTQMSRAAIRRLEEAYSFERGRSLMERAFTTAGLRPQGRPEPFYVNRTRPRWQPPFDDA